MTFKHLKCSTATEKGKSCEGQKDRTTKIFIFRFLLFTYLELLFFFNRKIIPEDRG